MRPVLFSFHSTAQMCVEQCSKHGASYKSLCVCVSFPLPWEWAVQILSHFATNWSIKLSDQTQGPLQNRCTDSIEITWALSDAGLIDREPASPCHAVSTPVPVGLPHSLSDCAHSKIKIEKLRPIRNHSIKPLYPEFDRYWPNCLSLIYEWQDDFTWSVSAISAMITW